MFKTALTLYALSSISVLAGAAVAPAMGRIADYFPGTDPLLISMIIAIPSLIVIPCTFLSHRLCVRFGKKNVLIGGLLLYFAGGCGAGFADSIGTLLLFRAVLGLGMGTITPVCQSLPSDFYTGKALVGVVGRMSAFLTIGAAVCSVGAGWLALVSWRASFGIYAVSLPVLALVLLFLPPLKTGDSRSSPSGSNGAAPTSAMPGIIFAVATTMLLYMAVFYAMPLGIAIHLEGAGIGNAMFAGNILALVSLAGFATGMFFPRLLSWFGNKLLPALLLGMGLGYMVIGQAESPVPVIVASFLIGFGTGGLTPLHYAAVNRLTPKPHVVRAMGLVIAGTFTGQFCSPFLTRGVASLPFVHTSGEVYGILGAGMAVMGGRSADYPFHPEKRRLIRQLGVYSDSLRSEGAHGPATYSSQEDYPCTHDSVPARRRLGLRTASLHPAL